MSEKSRGNWALGKGVSKERWDEIFKKKTIFDIMIDKLRGEPKK